MSDRGSDPDLVNGQGRRSPQGNAAGDVNTTVSSPGPGSDADTSFEQFHFIEASHAVQVGT